MNAEDWRLRKIFKLAHPLLQKYDSQPPGEGLGIVYAGVCGNGLVYVGRHIHGTHGRGVKGTRWSKHKNSKTHLGNSIRKHGVDWYIIAHDEEDRIPAIERAFISKDGLNTLSPNGLNYVDGDCDDDEPYRWSAAMTARMKEARNEPEYKQKARDRQKKWLEEESSADYDGRIAKQKETKAQPEWKAKQSQRAREACKNQDPEVRELQLKRIREKCTSVEYKEKRSLTHWTLNETEEQRDARLQKTREKCLKKREEKYNNASPEERKRLDRQNRKNDAMRAKRMASAV